MADQPWSGERPEALGDGVRHERGRDRFDVRASRATTSSRRSAATRDFYERMLLDALAGSFIGPGDLVVDAGANLGNHTLFFARVCKARVVASRPSRRMSTSSTQRRGELPWQDLVTVRRVALGAGPGRVDFDGVDWANVGSTSFTA